MNVLALCAGIGGLELGLHLAEPGANPVVFVEQNEFCRSVLAARWPGVPIWDDVTTFDGRPWAGEIDVITGGFPCQPWSVAGKRLGMMDYEILPLPAPPSPGRGQEGAQPQDSRPPAARDKSKPGTQTGPEVAA